MPAEQTDTLILRVFPWSETSLIVNLYSRDFGKLAAVAKGARRPKSPFEAALDLLSVCRVVFIAKSGDVLDILTEAKLQKRFRAGTRNLLRLYAGYYVAELLDRLTDKGDRQPEIYDLAVATLAALEEPNFELRCIVLRYELQMFRLIGQLPSWRKCAQCGNEADDVEWLTFSSLSGGVLCDACRIGARDVLRLPRSVRDLYERFSLADWQSMELESYPSNHRAASRGVVQHYLTVMLDRRLQMHSYLEELGR
ncbi:DNA repair protein RecO [Aureliella helgolandensis]|uniref:DNA repair protein RecO n=1 Tax=Aureliella helgolandensis TaxID=2527968 RepID=A0A518FZS7_9BACT|nr:DNA repair protein RecO [Aureliella helgolandensis]QDV21800.1 DNA repair protein RecO [Aureliella helgolandensis]